jgi:hypothetical protein
MRRWIELSRQVNARRLLVDGSFVTAMKTPEDVDAVLLVPLDFEQRIDRGDEAALVQEEMFLTRRPEELFAAEVESDWEAWVEFFGRTREQDGRRKGLVDLRL